MSTNIVTKSTANNLTIAFSWHRLPPYAAHLIRAGIDALKCNVHIIASRPVALVEEVEQICGQQIHWVDAHTPYNWSSMGLPPPDIFFQSGWLSQAFRDLGQQVKNTEGKVICLSDNSWKNIPRQWAGAVAFRAKYSSYFDAVWVPGVSGTQLMRFYGMPSHRIYKSMYGANPSVFWPGISLEKREKQFIFVGQLIGRKGVVPLMNAFKRFYHHFPEWRMKIIGNGPLEHLVKTPGVEWEGFQPPSYVAKLMRESRFLVLPSYEDHWGLVIHEATSSGCGLVVSNTVGAAFDLVGEHNGCKFQSGSEYSLYKALVSVAKENEVALKQCYEESLSLASKFGPKVWANTLLKIVTDIYP